VQQSTLKCCSKRQINFNLIRQDVLSVAAIARPAAALCLHRSSAALRIAQQKHQYALINLNKFLTKFWPRTRAMQSRLVYREMRRKNR